MAGKYKYHKESIIRSFINDLSYVFKPECEKKSKFVIFGRGRSGSTVLVSLLNTLNGVYCDGEVYNVNALLPKARLRRACYFSDYQIYGFKLLSYQLFRYSYKYQMHFLSYLLNNGFKIIYLKRENLLMHAVSNVRAREFRFHSKDSNENLEKKITVDLSVLMYWLELSEMRERKEESLVSSIPHLRLKYEENIENPAKHKETSDTVCDFLNISRGEVATQYKKISPLRLEDSIENYQEIKDKLINTRFEKYLYY